MPPINLVVDVTGRIDHEITSSELRQAFDIERDREEAENCHRSNLSHEPPGAVGYPQPTDEARQEQPLRPNSGLPGGSL